MRRTLLALREQTLSTTQWELLIIDNASEPAIASEFEIDWHPNGRFVVESKLGLTAARLRGIDEALGDLLVLVDDDNLLDPDYLERSLEISHQFPEIGVWGGQVVGEFETSPPRWSEPHLYALAIREFTSDSWASWYVDNRVLPCGAGMCVRSEPARRYAQMVVADERRARLDRQGDFLSSSGDTDLALSVAEQGFGMGQFARLRLLHLIPRQRLTVQYFERLYEGMGFSSTVLLILRHPNGSVRKKRTWRKLRDWLKDISTSRIERGFRRAYQRGRVRAMNLLLHDE